MCSECIGFSVCFKYLYSLQGILKPFFSGASDAGIGCTQYVDFIFVPGVKKLTLISVFSHRVVFSGNVWQANQVKIKKTGG